MKEEEEEENMTTHEALINSLRDKTYSSLEIKKINRKCYLIIHFETYSRTFINKFKKPKEYRHIWQISDWLKANFDIEKEQLKLPINSS
ncbi:hypothetical protein [uncultured Dokdonia sp.]|uniref:hypothetical protein n=1 Tax=uncultured Dokdonia sp. TaxID=575653 RepID=UPI00260B8CE4|nr:hypothetical protein [uncultured Dokdonia sp.]